MDTLCTIAIPVTDTVGPKLCDVAMWTLPVLFGGAVIGVLIVVAILVFLALKFLNRYK